MIEKIIRKYFPCDCQKRLKLKLDRHYLTDERSILLQEARRVYKNDATNQEMLDEMQKIESIMWGNLKLPTDINTALVPFQMLHALRMNMTQYIGHEKIANDLDSISRTISKEGPFIIHEKESEKIKEFLLKIQASLENLRIKTNGRPFKKEGDLSD